MGKYDGQLRIGFSIDENHPVAKALQDLSTRSNFSVNTVCKLICVDYFSKKQNGLPVITTISQDGVQIQQLTEVPNLDEQDKEIQQMVENSARMGMDDVFIDDEPEGE
jgi:hypothetical protein